MKLREEIEFLKESNAIEGVYDADSFKQALYAWEYLKEQPVMSVGVILKTHKMLMLNQHLYPDQIGYFRKVGVTIGGRNGMPIWEIRPYMEEWVKKANEDKLWRHIKLTHVAYEYCHPFVDGNGRTGRMFMNWARLKNGLKIKIIKEADRFEYYKWFN